MKTDPRRNLKMGKLILEYRQRLVIILHLKFGIEVVFVYETEKNP